MRRIPIPHPSILLVLAVIAVQPAAGLHFTLAGQPQNTSSAAQVPAAKLEAGPRVAAISPFIDTHVHLERAVAEGSIEIAVHAMQAENSAKYLFLPSPFAADDKGTFDIEFVQAAARNYPDRVSVLGGGGSLNPMIGQAVRAGSTSPELENKFKERAEQIARLGAVGFGELTAEHAPSASTPTYESVPPDHQLFLDLADIAAEHGLPITLHMEAVSEAIPFPPSWRVNGTSAPPELKPNIPAFERLLAHNPKAKIVWAHEGWDNTGARTVALSRRLLRAHPNLYLELKIDPLEPGMNSPLSGGGGGKLKPEWLKLFQDFPDRFVIGSDQHYPMLDNGPQRWQAVVLLFNQLPSDLQHKIGTENAIRIYNLKAK